MWKNLIFNTTIFKDLRISIKAFFAGALMVSINACGPWGQSTENDNVDLKSKSEVSELHYTRQSNSSYFKYLECNSSSLRETKYQRSNCFLGKKFEDNPDRVWEWIVYFENLDDGSWGYSFSQNSAITESGHLIHPVSIYNAMQSLEEVGLVANLQHADGRFWMQFNDSSIGKYSIVQKGNKVFRRYSFPVFKVERFLGVKEHSFRTKFCPNSTELLFELIVVGSGDLGKQLLGGSHAKVDASICVSSGKEAFFANKLTIKLMEE